MYPSKSTYTGKIWGSSIAWKEKNEKTRTASKQGRTSKGVRWVVRKKRKKKGIEKSYQKQARRKCREGRDKKKADLIIPSQEKSRGMWRYGRGRKNTIRRRKTPQNVPAQKKKMNHGTKRKQTLGTNS